MARFDVTKYVDVQERINRFWSEHPDGSIVTRMVSNPADFNFVVFEASVYKDQTRTRPDSTGYAAEERGASDRDGANFTSWHENGETSAIGRAFANLGYATTREDRPSRQEMGKVNRMADEAELPTRTRSTTQNTVPPSNPDNHMPIGWTEFWNSARALGLIHKADAEKAIGDLGNSAEYALERLQAWAFENESQRALVS